MASGGGKAANPWENTKDSGEIYEDSSKDVFSPLKQKNQSTMLHSSVSAHELRDLDNMEKRSPQGSSPTGVLEACFKGPESDTVSSKDNTRESKTPSSNTQALSKWSKFFKLLKRRSTKRLAAFPPLPMSLTSKRKISTREDTEMMHIHKYRSSLKEFTLTELQTATKNFSNENLIAKGGFAEVYKGRLRNGELVAIKRLTKGTEHERTNGFLCEIGIIAYVDHPNTAKLIGCDSDGIHLVFQLSPLGSLGANLHGSNNKLDWSKRYKIALGTADGLKYLHETCQKRIIHRDIKADNILLTEDFEPQICDFGLAMWLPKQWTHHNVSKFEGTFGYFAPEYLMHGIVDEKTDVYAFGVLLLELITGRQALDDLQQSLAIWAKPLLDSYDITELVDPSLGDNYDPEEMDRVVLTASLCIKQSPILRPRMTQVVILLKGDKDAVQCAKDHEVRDLQRTYSEELLHAQEYNSTRYLKDLNRHKEVAFGHESN